MTIKVGCCHEYNNAIRPLAALACKETKATVGVEKLDAVADRGHFNGEEILACEKLAPRR